LCGQVQINPIICAEKGHAPVHSFFLYSGNGIKCTFLSVKKNSHDVEIPNMFFFKLKYLRIFGEKRPGQNLQHAVKTKVEFCAGVPNVVGVPVIAELSAAAGVMVFLASLLLLDTLLLLVSLLLLASGALSGVNCRCWSPCC
jgi:hypothetical protein